jgi:hypothetical protein
MEAHVRHFHYLLCGSFAQKVLQPENSGELE